MLDMTIRQCVEQMRKVCTNTVVCNNQTKIIIHEINADKMDYIGKIKWDENGRVKTIRGFFCSIIPSPRTKGLEELKKDKNIYLYDPKNIDEHGYDQNFFHKDDYYLKERRMNEFLSDNGGINHYDTISVYAYMMSDMMAMEKEMEEEFDE